MAIDPDIIEIELAFTKKSKALVVSLAQRISEWLTEPNYITYENLLERLELESDSAVQLEFPIHLHDAQQVTQLLFSLLRKSHLTHAEMLLLSCVHHPQIGLPLHHCLKKLMTECKVTLNIIELDQLKAAQYVKAAADKGFAPALYQIGVDYYFGFCVPAKDITMAIHYWQQAEKIGFPYASYRLGMVFENVYKNSDQAVLHYIKGATFAHGNSWFALGRLQQNKLVKDNLNLPLAIECYKSAAKQGNLKALLAIISSYQQGINVLPNSLVANIYYELYLRQADINQVLMHQKMQLFLSQMTFVENGTLKSETMADNVAKNLCNGFVLMMFRAALIGESEKYLNRLRSLSIKNDEQIKQMGQLYNQYKKELSKVSNKNLHQLYQCIKNCKDNNEKNRIRETHYNQLEQHVLSNLKLSEEQKELLLYAKEFYGFISSLIFAIKLINYSLKQNNKLLNNEDFLEVINIIPPDKMLTNEQSILNNKSLEGNNNGLSVQLIKQIIIFSFNFIEQELVDALNKIVFPGDYIIVSSTDHALYVKRCSDEFHFYDSAHSFEIFFSSIELVAKLKSCFFTSKNRDDIYLSVNLRIYAQEILPVRPTTKQLLDTIFSNRGSNPNINTQAWDGSTSLYLAARYNDVDVVKELLERGADCTIANKKGLTAAHIAIIFDHELVLDLLAQSKFDLKQVSVDGNDMVNLAVQSNSQAVIKILAKHAVNLNKPNAANITPIYLALKYKRYNIVIELLYAMKSADILRKQDSEFLITERDKLLMEFFEVVDGIKNNQDKLKYIDAVLETDKNKQNALGQFFRTPTNSIMFFFSTKDKTGSILNIEEYRSKLVARMTVVSPYNSNLTPSLH